MCNSSAQLIKYGAKPVNIQWSVIRGDTATLTVDFLQIDESTPFSTSGWTYEATAYDAEGDVLDCLLVSASAGSVTITAPSSTTVNWGSQYRSIVAEMQFDLQIRIPTVGEDTVWTPVIGTIIVLGDVTPGGSL